MFSKAKIVLQILKRVAILGNIRKELRAFKKETLKEIRALTRAAESHDKLYRKRQILFDKLNRETLQGAVKQLDRNRELYRKYIEEARKNNKLYKENQKLQKKVYQMQLKQGGRK